jgi:hypothetical protein
MNGAVNWDLLACYEMTPRRADQRTLAPFRRFRSDRGPHFHMSILHPGAGAAPGGTPAGGGEMFAVNRSKLDKALLFAAR